MYIPEDVYQELREAVSEMVRLLEQLIGLSNQVIRWLDIRFPEFNEVFKDWTGDVSGLTLKNYPTSTKVVFAGSLTIVGTWSKDMKKPSLKRTEKLRGANESIGRTAGNEVAEAALQNLLSQYETILKQS